MPHSITPQGKNLTVVIAGGAGRLSDWRSFAAWYSVRRNLPRAEIVLAWGRSPEVDEEAFRWRHRTHVRAVSHAHLPGGEMLAGLATAVQSEQLSGHVLVCPDTHLCVRPLQPETLAALGGRFSAGGGVWVVENSPQEIVAAATLMRRPATQPGGGCLATAFGRPAPVPLLGGTAGGGDFVAFVDTSRGLCRFQAELASPAAPFAEAHHLAGPEVTGNGVRALQLWADMAAAWDAVR